MKKVGLSLLIAMVMIAALFCAVTTASAASSGTCGENLTWTLDDSGTLTISGSGEMDDGGGYSWDRYNIKNVVIGENVTRIASIGFYRYKNLESVTIAGGTTIGCSAFSRCENLKVVSIGDGATVIENGAFCGCKNLTTVNIGYGTISIDDMVFDSCSNLKNVNISGTVTDIGEQAFLDCTNLESDIIKNGVITIGRIAFSGCSKLKKVTLPGSVKSIGDAAFGNCESLESIDVAPENGNYSSVDGVLFNKDKTVIIGYPAGRNTTNYDIPGSVKSIDKSAFSGCYRLVNVTIPESVTSIGDLSFGGCTGLVNITIPESVTSIGERAFSGCTGLTSVFIPNSITKLSSNLFSGCSNLKCISVKESHTDYCTENGILFSKDKSTIVSFPCGKNDKEYVIPETVTQIGDWAFSYCINLENITITNNVSEIGQYAFGWCNGIRSIVIPGSVTVIRSGAFRQCGELESVTIGENVEQLGSGAFRECAKLAQINWNAKCVADFNEYNAVFGTSGYSGEGIKVVFGDSVETIPSCCFYIESGGDVPKITSITIGKNVKSIGKYAFSDCEELASVTIGENVKSIGEYAFFRCDELTSVTIGDNVASIGKGAFFGCKNFTSVTIGNGVTYIGSYAFEGCDKIETAKYRGTEAEWNAIEIEYGNTSLVKAIQSCGSAVKNIKRTETGVELEIAINKDKMEAFESAEIIVAIYDDENKFIGVETVTIDADDTTKTVRVETDETSDYAKIMLWNTLDSINPLCGDSELALN